jgi:hypothetical protein
MMLGNLTERRLVMTKYVAPAIIAELDATKAIQGLLKSGVAEGAGPTQTSTPAYNDEGD